MNKEVTVKRDGQIVTDIPYCELIDPRGILV